MWCKKADLKAFFAPHPQKTAVGVNFLLANAYFISSQKLMALAAATLRESTPWYMGIMTR